MNENNEKTGFFGGLANVLTGAESIKFEVQFETASVAMLCGGALLVGLLLIIINRKIK